MSITYVGIVSDSHGRLDNMKRMAAHCPDVAAWIHAGDYCEDSKALEAYAGVPVYAVRGNNDFVCRPWPDQRCIDIAGVTIFVTHGHQWYGESRRRHLLALGQAQGASLVVFGHSHRKFLETVQGIWLVNPGSISLPRDSRQGTYGICTIENGHIKDVKLYQVT